MNSIVEECLEELRRLKAQVLYGTAAVTITLESGEDFFFPKWKFDMLCIMTHDKTEHRCSIGEKV